MRRAAALSVAAALLSVAAGCATPAPPRWTIVVEPTTAAERGIARGRGLPVPLVRGTPRYPAELVQKIAPIEGCAVVEFDIRPDGMTDNFLVLRSTPSGAFDDLAIAAIYNSRFEPSAGLRATQVIHFAVEQSRVAEGKPRNPTSSEQRREAALQDERCGHSFSENDDGAEPAADGGHEDMK